MKTALKIIGMTFLALVVLGLILVGPLALIPAVMEFTYVGINVDFILNCSTIIIVVSSFLAGALLVLWMWFLAKMIKTRRMKRKGIRPAVRPVVNNQPIPNPTRSNDHLRNKINF